MAIVYVLCLVSAALAVGWHGHARVTCGSDRCWSGWTGVAFRTPAAALFAVVVAVADGALPMAEFDPKYAILGRVGSVVVYVAGRWSGCGS